MSIMGDIMSTVGDIMSTVGDIMSTVGDIQYHGDIMINVRLLNIPMVLTICIMIFSTALNAPTAFKVTPIVFKLSP